MDLNYYVDIMILLSLGAFLMILREENDDE